jgi:uncharacterized membrane protein YcjF (UPF0283 family)
MKPSRKHAPVWYLDKVLGIGAILVGLALLVLPAMAVQAFWGGFSAMPALYWVMGAAGLFSIFAGIMQIIRAGWV